MSLLPDLARVREVIAARGITLGPDGFCDVRVLWHAVSPLEAGMIDW